MKFRKLAQVGFFIALLAGVVCFASGLNTSGTAIALGPVALNQLAEKELNKHMRYKGTWAERIPSKNKWVNNDVIKITEIGADPDVLINNNTYPIETQKRTDGTIVIALHKYETKNTEVHQDELYALPYDKEGSVQRQHRETLEEEQLAHGLHSLAPMKHDAKNTPILETTGETDPDTGYKKLRKADLRKFAKTLDNLKYPKKGRILVLNPNHKDNLLEEDEKLENRFHDHKENKTAGKLYTFELYDDINQVKYTDDLEKIPFETEDDGRPASVFIFLKRTGKALGTAERYFRDRKTDPENRKSVVGFTSHAIFIPTATKSGGAIVSGKSA